MDGSLSRSAPYVLQESLGTRRALLECWLVVLQRLDAKASREFVVIYGQVPSAVPSRESKLGYRHYQHMSPGWYTYTQVFAARFSTTVACCRTTGLQRWGTDH